MIGDFVKSAREDNKKSFRLSRLTDTPKKPRAHYMLLHGGTETYIRVAGKKNACHMIEAGCPLLWNYQS